MNLEMYTPSNVGHHEKERIVNIVNWDTTRKYYWHMSFSLYPLQGDHDEDATVRQIMHY